MNELKMALLDERHGLAVLLYILGISVIQDKEKNWVCLHQRHYIEAILQKYGMDNEITSQPLLMSMSSWGNLMVSLSQCTNIPTKVCCSGRMTRHIAQAVSAVSKFNANPKAAHTLLLWKGYFNTWKGQQTLLSSETLRWLGLSDDYRWLEIRQYDCRSTTGNIFRLSGGTVGWLCKKQAIVALSILWIHLT